MTILRFGVEMISKKVGAKAGVIKAAPKLNEKKISLIASKLLDFDPKNPRFYRLRGDSSDEKVVEEMLDDEGVQDLMSSIGQQGYFPGEPLLVAPGQNGRLIVVEGNRRLTAVKLLNGELLPPRRKSRSVALIVGEAKFRPTEIPCIQYESRDEILRYLGYRHITGIKEWDALSKARYLADLRETFYKDLDAHTALRTIAKEIGSRADAVGKLLTGLELFDAADDSKFFSRHNLNAEAIDFSYITTAIGYKNIANWLGIEDGALIQNAEISIENLELLFYWMFVPQANARTVVGETRRLKDLAAVIGSEDGRRVLLETGNLVDAYLYTDGPQQALSAALHAADAKLRLVWDTLRKSTPTEEHKDAADDLLKQARKIYEQISTSIAKAS